MPATVDFQLKSETDLYDLAKRKTTALSLAFGHGDELMALYCKDRMVRIFSFASGKLLKVYNETLQKY